MIFMFFFLDCLLWQGHSESTCRAAVGNWPYDRRGNLPEKSARCPRQPARGHEPQPFKLSQPGELFCSRHLLPTRA